MGRLIDADELARVWSKECAQDCASCMLYHRWDAETNTDHCLLIDNAPTVKETE